MGDRNWSLAPDSSLTDSACGPILHSENDKEKI